MWLIQVVDSFWTLVALSGTEEINELVLGYNIWIAFYNFGLH